MRREWVVGGPAPLPPLPEEVPHTFWLDAVVEEDREIIVRRISRLLSGRESEDEVRILTPAGPRRVRLLGYPQLADGELVRVIGAAIDLSDLAPAGPVPGGQDPLTGLATYPGFQERLQAAIGAARRSDRGIAVLFVNFRAYNDIALNFGVPAADAAAVQAAHRLRRAAPAEAQLARIHSDEFVCFVPGLPAGGIPLLAAGIQAVLAAPLELEEGVQVSVEPVIGAACYPQHGDLARHLVRRAGIAAAIAARRGEDCHLFEHRSDEVRSSLLLMQDLRAALSATDQLSLAYQPQVELATGRIVGVEALLRWRHPVHGSLPPGRFLPQAEATRLIQDLFHWTLEAGLAQRQAWHAAHPALRLSLNLSGRNLADPGLARAVLDALGRAGLPPGALTLEVTETALIDYEAGIAQLRALAEAGIGISMDDFGTGYSALSYLQRLPLTELKIDRSFAADIDRNRANERLVSLILSIAEMFGLDTVAEGVEDEGAAAALARLGCRAVQGYFYGHPVPAAELRLDTVFPPQACGAAERSAAGA